MKEETLIGILIFSACAFGLVLFGFIFGISYSSKELNDRNKKIEIIERRNIVLESLLGCDARIRSEQIAKLDSLLKQKSD